jgi:uncharacterized repeat protein (TIGR03803 family)
MPKPGTLKMFSIAAVFCVSAVLGAAAQTFNSLAAFDFTNGVIPGFGALAQGTNGNFYGTTQEGGANNSNGVVFEITPSGVLTPIYSFCAEVNCADGELPQAQPVLATNGNLYGTTYGGGNGTTPSGVIYEITPAGKYSVIYNFCSQANCTDGANPGASPIQAANGNFYGTTELGGPNNQGVVYELTSAGKYTVIYSFCSLTNCADGAEPLAGLVQGTNGNFYGTTQDGGANNNFDAGVVYEIDSAGKYSVLYSFCALTNCADGSNPRAALLQAANGNFYGTTYGGGDENGTMFQITPAGKFKSLHTFCGSQCGDGGFPYGALIQATNGNLYGTTQLGGDENGVIFEFTQSGAINILYTFCSAGGCADGAQPEAGLLQATNGNLYGVTALGGTIVENCTIGCGTVFSLSEGLGPFVETLPTSGKVGKNVIILGNDLSGATAVNFNGTAATFTVVSNSEIKTTVPSGATTGTVTLTTSSGGTLNSKAAFRVTK